MNIGMLLVMIIGGAAGAFSTVYLVVSLFVVIGYKIFRSLKYRVSLYD